MEARRHEKALFDFDEEINDLETVEDRYPVITPAMMAEEISKIDK